MYVYVHMLVHASMYYKCLCNAGWGLSFLRRDMPAADIKKPYSWLASGAEIGPVSEIWQPSAALWSPCLFSAVLPHGYDWGAHQY